MLNGRSLASPRTYWVRLGLCAVALLVVASIAYLVIPRWLAGQCGDASVWWDQLVRIECEKNRGTLIVEERRNLLAITAGILAALTLYYTHQRQRLSQDETGLAATRKPFSNLETRTKQSG